MKLVKGVTTRQQVEAKAIKKYGTSLDLSVVEVLCKCPGKSQCGCEVEPDGRCEHNCRSILLVAGFI